MKNLMDLASRKIAVIGASSGIGKTTALVLSRLGAVVFPVARREEKLQELMAELEGTGHAYYTADVSLPENIDALFKAIREEQGPLDGLVYCAGVNSSLPLQQLKPEKLREVFDINYFAFVETVRQATRRGRFNEGMRIVAVSSNAAIRGDKAHTAYSASKAAMNASIRCLAKELADRGIGINAVAPAVTNTEIYREYAQGSGALGSEEELLKRQYLGLIETEDVAAVTAFLLSPASRMMTGLTIPVDGGLSTN